ncbi:MAG: hypothetical protein II410_08205 [Ruminococcus sp.]|nr:hypothetical protein [Ruminococcus sp.]
MEGTPGMNYRQAHYGRRKYLLTDILDCHWSRSSNSLETMITVANSRRKSAPDSVLQLYRLDSGDIYRPIDFPGESKERKEACTRDGIVCGHRRRFTSASTGTNCMYIFDTGVKRGCPLGEKCGKYTTEECHERDDLFSDY